MAVNSMVFSGCDIRGWEFRKRMLKIEMLFEEMVHPGGFEPPTARFVAEYSIQLSYGCIEIFLRWTN